MSFGEYEGGLRGLIHLLKYEAVLPVASVLGGMLSDTIQELLPACGDSVPLIVPVPLHKGKRSDRGFNQAELIARAAVKRLIHPATRKTGAWRGPRLTQRLELTTGVLIRRRATISQVGLTREQRIENMRDAFQVRDAPSLRDRTVIVVDDVMTTGTTLSECARVLKQAGAERVLAAVVARAFQGTVLHDTAVALEHKTVIDAEEEASEAVAVTASV